MTLRTAGVSAAAATAALAMSVLLSALVPYLPFGEDLVRVFPGDRHEAFLVAVGLVLLALAGMVLAVTRFVTDRPPTEAKAVPVVLAAMVPAAVMGIAVIHSAGALLDPAIGAAPQDRQLLLGGAFAFVLAPMVVALALVRRRTPTIRAGVGSVRWEAAGLIGLTAGFVAVVSLGIAARAPFTADESIYAVAARSWLFGGPASGWGLHRPPGLPALGLVPLLVDSSETALRMVSLVFGIGLLIAVWYLVRLLAGPTAGLVAALATAGIPTIQLNAGLFLNDVPSTAVLLLLFAVLWRQFGPHDQAPGWGLVWLAPLGAAAFTLRYGSIVPLLALAGAMVVIWPRQLAMAWRKAVATLALLALLLLPYAVIGVGVTGSPVAFAQRALTGSEPQYLGAGLIQYLAWLPAPLVGIVAAGLAILGLLAAMHRLTLAALRRRWDRGSRVMALLTLPAIVQFSVFGLVALPQERYVFLPMTLLVAAGCVAVVDVTRMRGVIGRTAALGVAMAVLVGMLMTAVDMSGRAAERAEALGWQRAAGEAIRQVGAGSCSVLTADVPQFTWYSGCRSIGYGNLRVARRDAALTGEHRFLVVRSDAHQQPSAAVMGEYLARAEPTPVGIYVGATGRIAATVYRFAAPTD